MNKLCTLGMTMLLGAGLTFAEKPAESGKNATSTVNKGAHNGKAGKSGGKAKWISLDSWQWGASTPQAGQSASKGKISPETNTIVSQTPASALPKPLPHGQLPPPHKKKSTGPAPGAVPCKNCPPLPVPPK